MRYSGQLGRVVGGVVVAVCAVLFVSCEFDGESRLAAKIRRARRLWLEGEQPTEARERIRRKLELELNRVEQAQSIERARLVDVTLIRVERDDGFMWVSWISDDMPEIDGVRVRERERSTDNRFVSSEFNSLHDPTILINRVEVYRVDLDDWTWNACSSGVAQVGLLAGREIVSNWVGILVVEERRD